MRAAVDLQVLLGVARHAAVERRGMLVHRRDGVVLAGKDQRGHGHRREVGRAVPRRLRRGRLDRRAVLRRDQRAATPHRPAHHAHARGVDAVVDRAAAGAGERGHLVERGQLLARAAGRLVKGRVGVDGDDHEAV